MSLRVRLILLTVALVTLVAVALSALYLNSLVNTLSASALERSELAGQQVNAFVIDHINQHSVEYEPPKGLDETKEMWSKIVQNDPDITNMLERTMALSPALVEINVAGANGGILASSNPLRIASQMKAYGSFSNWRSLSFNQRLADLLIHRPDYQVTVPLGIAGQSDPVFTIQVVTSSVLLRSAVLPELETVGLISAGALILSLLLTGIATSRALQPIRRIEQTIDRIAQGNFRGEETGDAEIKDEPKEFAAVESKLNLLGQQYSGARKDATQLRNNLDDIVEQMASQLDVTSRLAAISRITSGVAHEIKNPLNAISLRLDLLRLHAEAASEDKLIPEIDILSKEVRRLDRVVKTFLDFSRPVEVKFAEVDLGTLTADVTQLIKPQAEAAGITVRFTTTGPMALIRGDADMLRQALLNLETNAIEAMKDGGRLRVSVENTGKSVVVEVADTGPGIPPELRDKVFQLYFTTKEKGSGIGLALTYRAVQLHNGTVEFWSEIGKGTEFRLQFPALVRHE
jgi:signal transduction histidine kinase